MRRCLCARVHQVIPGSCTEGDQPAALLGGVQDCYETAIEKEIKAQSSLRRDVETGEGNRSSGFASVRQQVAYRRAVFKIGQVARVLLIDRACEVSGEYV